ncbi:glycoside hydrolase superfamily [Xylariomycetidae sp. FL2044]|nr:glycoside hydrolase superfamily [Xylariomycetidae sp. FL2044]
MYLSSTVGAAALLAAPALAHYTKDYDLNAYWGQSGPPTDRLAQHCASSAIDYITIGFVNNSPENGDGTNYPGTNFAAHCAAEVYVKDGQNSKLLSACSYIKEDIKTCQSLGKKVLLSIGGEYSDSNNYAISTVQKGQEFADFMFDAFGPFDHSWEGPRPFDVSETDHTCLDGFDFDIEKKFDDERPYVAMINRLRERIHGCDGILKRNDMILTAAPQCPFTYDGFQMNTILSEAQFDKLFIQFYNNPVCEATGDGFNYDGWVNYVKGTCNEDVELYIGLPASEDASSSGYICPDDAKDLICKYKNKDNFAGVMLWDAYRGSVNEHNSMNYYEK